MVTAPTVYLPKASAWTFEALAETLADLRVDAFEVVHIGAHHGEEVPYYRAAGFTFITLVEPDPANIAVIRQRYPEPDVRVIEAACGDASAGRSARFHRNALSQLSGLIEHPSKPSIADLDVELIPAWQVQSDQNVLVIDTQGTEMDVLETARLGNLDMIIVEAYSGRGEAPAAPAKQLERWMTERGFVLGARWMYEQDHFDAVYVRG